MRSYPYQLVNVFAETHFGGNPLAVFYQADGLTNTEMQAIARQFNLSEVVFIQSSSHSQAVKKYKIFTPDYEMPFAGHPTIGASFVLKQLENLPEQYTIETLSGLVKITHQQDVIRFTLDNGIDVEESNLSIFDCAEILGLTEADIASQPSWVNTGAPQLLVELSSPQAVRNCQINANLFMQKALSKNGLPMLYIWHRVENNAFVRLFFGTNSTVAEDPGTGSAAANLGGWHIHHNRTPLTLSISQGDEIQRPNRLSLVVDKHNIIHVGGKVVLVGQGEFYLP